MVATHILGVSALYHDSAACLLTDGKIVAAAQEERFTRIKGDASLPFDPRNPLHHSQRFGYRLFNQADIASVRRDSAYVQRHANARLVGETLRRMRDLSQRYGLKVTVVLAPCDARLYGKWFEDMPATSARPYFLDYFGRLAKQNGFDVLNLAALMAPYS